MVGLLTGNILAGAKAKLRHFGLWDHFPFGVFADGLEDRDDVARRALAEADRHVGRAIDPCDVWVIGEDRGQRAAAELVLGDVLVVDAPVVSDSFASATSRQLVLAVPQDDEESLGLVLAASGDDRVRVVGRS